MCSQSVLAHRFARKLARGQRVPSKAEITAFFTEFCSAWALPAQVGESAAALFVEIASADPSSDLLGAKLSFWLVFAKIVHEAGLPLLAESVNAAILSTEVRLKEYAPSDPDKAQVLKVYGAYLPSLEETVLVNRCSEEAMDRLTITVTVCDLIAAYLTDHAPDPATARAHIRRVFGADGNSVNPQSAMQGWMEAVRRACGAATWKEFDQIAFNSRGVDQDSRARRGKALRAGEEVPTWSTVLSILQSLRSRLDDQTRQRLQLSAIVYILAARTSIKSGWGKKLLGDLDEDSDLWTLPHRWVVAEWSARLGDGPNRSP
jgi:hypothetical protein